MRDSRAVIGAGTIVSPIIKVVTTVAILAAIYFLAVRPVLDSAESLSGGSSPAVEALEQSRQELRQARTSALNYVATFLAGSQPWPEASQWVRDCVRRAGTAIVRLDRCQRVAQQIASQVLSNRNFAVSYADNLEAQGRSGDAGRVRECVKEAQFDVRQMAACRSLANKLLFG